MDTRVCKFETHARDKGSLPERLSFFDTVKTYLVTSMTNYGLAVHLVNANNKKHALKLANEVKGFPAWPGAEAHLVNKKRKGVTAFYYE